jgi:hypothetical protein
MSSKQKDADIWRKMLGLWQDQNVPAVEIIPFPGTSHGGFSAWRRRGALHYVADSNPLQLSAYHLIVHLRGASPALLAAYYLHAFCVDHEVSHWHWEALSVGFSENGSEIQGWWRQNTRIVLPGVNLPAGAYKRFERDSLKRWQDMVLTAAFEWALIAEQWVLVRVPDLMDRDSSEWHAWSAQVSRDNDERERLEYERFKKKFGA